MPVAYSQTKAGRTHALLQRLERGPSLSPIDFDKETIAKFEYHYKLWASTWVLPEARALLPQRKDKP